MSRRSPLFSLSAMTRAYKRQLKVLVRATKPVKPPRTKSRAASSPRSKTGTPVKASVSPHVATPKKGVTPAKAPRKTAQPADAPGDWVSGIAPGPAGARRFQLYKPGSALLQPGEKVPLLVMLHGCGQTGLELAAVSRMNRLAARAGFWVLYPEQERVANAHRCWNWFEQRNGKAQAEAATLLAAVDHVARRQPVDLTRVAVAGLSAGATMAAWMAAYYPSRFCAVAMHSGAAVGTAASAATALSAMRGRRPAHLPEPHNTAPATVAPQAVRGALTPVRLPPLLVLHGVADAVVSERNASASATLWAQALGARPGPPRNVQRGNRHLTRVTEFTVRGRSVVVLREVSGLAHAWSGGAAGHAYSDPAGPDASALIWAFVARQFQSAAAA